MACGLLSCGMRASYLQHAGLSCGMRTLSCGMHVGSSSLTRDRTWAPCVGSVESYLLHHQGSPARTFFKQKEVTNESREAYFVVSFSLTKMICQKIFIHSLPPPPPHPKTSFRPISQGEVHQGTQIGFL